MYAENGAWFKAHPEVMKWTYLKSWRAGGSQRTFGFDPFPDQRKICQCFEGALGRAVPYQEFRPQTAALGAAMQAADAEPDILSLKVRDRPWWRRRSNARSLPARRRSARRRRRATTLSPRAVG